MKNGIIIQARMGSKRLPQKVMRKICGTPVIGLIVSRSLQSNSIDEVIVATTTKREDDELCEYLQSINCKFFRGNDEDVRSRYIETANTFKIDNIVRVTADCPIVDPQMIDEMMDLFIKNQDVDYLTNRLPPTFPDGLDIEIFSREALIQSASLSSSKFDLEHVTPMLYKADFTVENFRSELDLSRYRWTVDEIDDLFVIRKIYENFFPDIFFGWKEALAFAMENPDLTEQNLDITRDEGSVMNDGQKLWKRSKNVIMGGNMLFSKQPNLHLPGKWPTYFSKTSECFVWDLEDNRYTDIYLMGVGTNILGYSHPEVDSAVQQVVSNGNMSTFNAPEEVLLAEKLLQIDPWAGKVKFTRSGGEAITVALRIARAATGKDEIAFCGYHGWHDWYLAANLGKEDKLSEHLLPGLDPLGVPKNLIGTAHCFEYNKIDQLKDIIGNKNIGVIVMEVSRNHAPKNDFLKKVRDIANRNGIVLVFDECSSGFRSGLGGLYRKFNITPDMVVYGKTMGNGYAINAIVGKDSVMSAASNSFISSTFWTERIGFAAALATIKVMEETSPWDALRSAGEKIKTGWSDLSTKYDIPINITGSDTILSFSFHSPRALEYKTFITQEMLKEKMLAATTVYVCTCHTEKIVNQYLEHLSVIFRKISEFERHECTTEFLEHDVCIPNFGRVN